MTPSALLYIGIAFVPAIALIDYLQSRHIRHLYTLLSDPEKALITPPDNKIPKGPERTPALDRIARAERRREIVGVALFVLMILVLILHSYLT